MKRLTAGIAAVGVCALLGLATASSASALPANHYDLEVDVECIDGDFDDAAIQIHQETPTAHYPADGTEEFDISALWNAGTSTATIPGGGWQVGFAVEYDDCGLTPPEVTFTLPDTNGPVFEATDGTYSLDEDGGFVTVGGAGLDHRDLTWVFHQQVDYSLVFDVSVAGVGSIGSGTLVFDL
ncbi:MAG TPA: hypothetical protein VNQ73_12435 [Ilumatobacter sp.]|nr:hypothetical protein [Ilumatobacter sp.]